MSKTLRVFLAALIAGTTGQLFGATLFVQLVSNAGGVYDYELVNPPNGFFLFNQGTTSDQIMLSGMSGVTGESDSGAFAGIYPTPCATATTASTACFAAVATGSAVGPGGSSPTDFPTWEVDSTVTTLGTINYTIDAEVFNGSAFVPTVISGTVQGPVGTSNTPEPASLLLVCGGLTAIAFRHRSLSSKVFWGFSGNRSVILF